MTVAQMVLRGAILLVVLVLVPLTVGTISGGVAGEERGDRAATGSEPATESEADLAVTGDRHQG